VRPHRDDRAQANAALAFADAYRSALWMRPRRGTGWLLFAGSSSFVLWTVGYFAGFLSTTG
jgi:hypothetical protein